MSACIGTEMDTSLVIVDRVEPGVVRLTINRPDKRNALNVPLMQAVCDAIQAAANEPEQRVLILRGAGPVFCAGLDLQVASSSNSECEQAVQWVGKLVEAVHSTRLVTIAAVHGAALAGGAGLMSACDFVIAAEGTRIGYPEGRRGLVAGLVMTFLRRQLRERHIRELLFTGELIDAERAREIGLVNRVVPPNELGNETDKIVAAVLQNAPGALASTKKLIEELWSSSVKEDVERALRHHMEARESVEAK